MRARKRERECKRRTSAKCEAIVNILVVAAFFAAELYNCNEERACIAVVSFSQRHFFFFFLLFSSFLFLCYVIMVVNVFDVFAKMDDDRLQTLCSFFYHTCLSE